MISCLPDFWTTAGTFAGGFLVGWLNTRFRADRERGREISKVGNSISGWMRRIEEASGKGHEDADQISWDLHEESLEPLRDTMGIAFTLVKGEQREQMQQLWLEYCRVQPLDLPGAERRGDAMLRILSGITKLLYLSSEFIEALVRRRSTADRFQGIRRVLSDKR